MFRPKPLLVATVLALAPLTAAAADRAGADIVGAGGKVLGTATLVEAPTGILIRVDLRGLPPGDKAIHIHAVGTCDDHDHGFVASKAHLNPQGRKHGLLNPEGPDAGDLPNVRVHADGTAMAEFFTTLASLGGKGGRPALLDADGAALVLHANPDDHATQPIGGAGARIGCGVVKAR
ncbi:superoxide dismutase family protein [Stella sp.]|uniref:superoxide dismutase family protein n=1 Tax=Stella sp. TaxID=2912054 RepID=UPI0035AECCE0